MLNQIDARDTILSQGLYAADEAELEEMAEDRARRNPGVGDPSMGHTAFAFRPGARHTRGPPKSDVRYAGYPVLTPRFRACVLCEWGRGEAKPLTSGQASPFPIPLHSPPSAHTLTYTPPFHPSIDPSTTAGPSRLCVCRWCLLSAPPTLVPTPSPTALSWGSSATRWLPSKPPPGLRTCERVRYVCCACQ